MPVETKLMLICLTLLGLALVYAVLRVIGAWYENHIARHDLIAESKRRRFMYLKSLADRERELQAMEEAEAGDSVIIEDDEPELAEAEFAQAA